MRRFQPIEGDRVWVVFRAKFSKVNFTIEQAKKAQRGSIGITLLFL
jgi:hypothetical protein